MNVLQVQRNTSTAGYDTIDVMKFICALMVIVIHCKPLKPYSDFLSVLTAEGICRIAVPFFFCTSGLLLYGKLSLCSPGSNQPHRLCRKAWLGNVKLYLAWSALYWAFSIPEWNTRGLLSWEYMLDQFRCLLIDEGSYYHFWYMVALIYALPLMLLLWKFRSRTLVFLIGLLWPIQCIRYSYRWLPGGNILPWDSDYFDALLNTVFCAIPMLAMGILCFRYHKKYGAKRWGRYTAICFVANIAELVGLYFFAPHTGHFEFLLTTPLLVFCLINVLLTLDVSFVDRRIPLVLRQASIWIYCIHPMLITAYGYVNDSKGLCRFIVVLSLCLLSAMAYILFKQSRINKLEKRLLS